MRPGVIAALLACSMPALAEPGPHLEASAFAGVDALPSSITLGGATQPEQRPQSAPMFGARLSGVMGVAPHLELAAEAELAVTTSWTGYGFDGPRPSYFAPVIGWRGGVLARLTGVPGIRPHLAVGGGGATVVSASPYVTNETQGLFYWGLGATFGLGGRWQLRVDGRQVVLPAQGGDMAASYELVLGLATSFGGRAAPAPAPHEVVVHAAPPAPPPPVDRDGDGLPDVRDACPTTPATTPDGCPPPDPDGDGLAGAADHCPDQPEDLDHFEDADGCPDLDNDSDGIPDANDKCPDQPETRNGIADADGCPDQVPADIAAALEGATAVRFEPGRVRVTRAAKRALERTLAVLLAHPELHVRITSYPDQGGEELAKKRGEAVKWYLVDRGIAGDQLAIAIGTPPAPKGHAIELALVPR